MLFKRHSIPEGAHAFLSPSNYHWINYDEEKLYRMYHSAMTAQRGSDLHNLAYNLIRLGVKLPTSKTTLNMYVNDAIGYKMTPEQPLYYSEFCFGRTDAISFRRNKLRVHDLKNGVLEAPREQVEIYVALFCLEYNEDPRKIEIECRIYQNDAIDGWVPDVGEIIHKKEQIIHKDRLLRQLKKEELS